MLLTEDMISFDLELGMPDMSYGWAKLTCEYLARLAYEKHGLKSVCYRPFSGYGEDQDDTYPFPSICKRASRTLGADVLTVWGTGRQMHNFIHIEDCVDGIFTTMDKIDDGDAINLSTGILTSFIEFARTAAEIVGYRPEVRGLSDKPVGVFARGGDTIKQRQLGFQHEIDFRTGIERALKYYSEVLLESVRLTGDRATHRGKCLPTSALKLPRAPTIPVNDRCSNEHPNSSLRTEDDRDRCRHAGGAAGAAGVVLGRLALRIRLLLSVPGAGDRP